MSSVRDNPAQHRYEIYDGDRLAGISEYKLTKNKIAFTHTEIDPAFGGRGLARELVTQELDDARRRDLAVLPFCPYVRKVIASNPEQYLDLVPARDRERFQLPGDVGVDDPDVPRLGDREAGQMTTTVVDVPERQRYEVVRGEATLGFAAYQKTDQLIVFTHTEVDRSMEGQGIGGQLVRGALDHVRTFGLPVLPICPFVQGWMARHPEYADLDYRRPPTSVTD